MQAAPAVSGPQMGASVARFYRAAGGAVEPGGASPPCLISAGSSGRSRRTAPGLPSGALVTPSTTSSVPPALPVVSSRLRLVGRHRPGLAGAQHAVEQHAALLLRAPAPRRRRSPAAPYGCRPVPPCRRRRGVRAAVCGLAGAVAAGAGRHRQRDAGGGMAAAACVGGTSGSGGAAGPGRRPALAGAGGAVAGGSRPAARCRQHRGHLRRGRGAAGRSPVAASRAGTSGTASRRPAVRRREMVPARIGADRQHHAEQRHRPGRHAALGHRRREAQLGLPVDLGGLGLEAAGDLVGVETERAGVGAQKAERIGVARAGR